MLAQKTSESVDAVTVRLFHGNDFPTVSEQNEA